MTRTRYAAGEIRFRVSKKDLDRIYWLLDNHSDQPPSVSALLRILILREFERSQPKTLLTKEI